MNILIDEIKQLAVEPNWQELSTLLDASRQGEAKAQRQICGALIWSAFACPAAITPVYDGIFCASSESQDALKWSDLECELPETFWQAFQNTLEGPEQGYDATSITATVAALGGATAPQFYELAEAAALQHPGAKNASTKQVPRLLELEPLGQCPESSLGRCLYRMLVDNGYDAEVLDRESIGLTQLPPATRYLNTRILQMHDVWHLVAGYETTSMHEIAISAFQLAQFGHNYSSMFLATVALMSQSNSSEAFNLMMLIFSEGWQHGRSTPPLMAIEFEALWDLPLDTLRNQESIAAFQGSLPADLFEQLKAS